MMKTQEFDGMTYTYVDEETYLDSNGGEWVLWERPDMTSKIEWAEKEMARYAGQIATDEDAASYYEECAEIIRDTRESLEIVDQLWGIW